MKLPSPWFTGMLLFSPCCKLALSIATALYGDCTNLSVLLTSDVSVVLQILLSLSEAQSKFGVVCAESRHTEMSEQQCWMKIAPHAMVS